MVTTTHDVRHTKQRRELVPRRRRAFRWLATLGHHASKPPTGKRLLGAGPRNDVVPRGHCP
jgi:hypothetical protein